MEGDDMVPETETGFKKVEEFTSYKSPATKLAEIQTYAVRGFKERAITKDVCEFFNVRVSYGSNGEIDTHYYPYDEGKAYKIRALPKTFTWVNKSDGLFGKDKFQGGGKRVIITEGEIDALSVAQASYKKYGKIYPVVAMSSAVMTKSLLENRDWLRSFKEVVLLLDNDEAGKKAEAEAIKILGIDKVKIGKMSEKDPNEMLVKHGFESLMQVIFDSTAYVPAGIISKDKLWEALQNYNNAVSVPYPSCMAGVNAKLKGMRGGEITLFISGTGCFGIDTPILMFDGSLKKAQDILVGDTVMGPDNTPRNVLSLFRGNEQLYRVGIRGGESFVCNESHVLSVVNNDSEGRWGLEKDQIVDVKLSDYMGWSDKRKHLSKTFKAGRLEFPAGVALPMHPYALGVWLGDGYSAGSRISSNDTEIPNALVELGYDVEKQATAFAWSFRGVKPLLDSLDLINNKHIPETYLKASVEDRLELFAGLIDTDGSYDSEGNGYEFSQKDEVITDQFIRLANSLGFQATKGKQVNNKFGNCFRVWVSGNGLEDIPVRLPRKQARPRLQAKNPLRFKTEITKLDVGDFYGFEVDGDSRFVLGNFIVTHNSGKSTILREIMLHLLETTNDKFGVVSLEESPAETARKLAGAAINKNPAKEELSLDELKEGFQKTFGSDRIVLLDHQGSINDSSIIDQLEYMVLTGCKYLFIDHITILVSEGVADLTGNEAQDKIMNDLLRLVKRHPEVWIGLVSHLRKAQGGKSFEEGNMPSIDDIRGSGSIKQISFDIIAFARNMIASSEREKNTIKMRILKSRFTGLTGDVQGSYYDYTTGRMKQLDDVVEEAFVAVAAKPKLGSSIAVTSF